MQMNFDLTDIEIVNLKRKIDELDPVAQAEKVVEYISRRRFITNHNHVD